MQRSFLLLIHYILVCAAGAETPFPGKQGSFHGFARHDFVHEGLSCIVVRPKQAADGRPWIWRARFFGHQPQLDLALLEKGFHLAYVDVGGLFGNREAVERWNRFYAYLNGTHGFAKKPALEGMSRGGLIIYNWASEHPERVACIYGDAPVCDIKSWPGGKGKGKGSAGAWRQCLKAWDMSEEEALRAEVNPIDRLAPLARAGVPLLHVVGDADPVVPVAENTAVLETRYRKLGGEITVIHKPGVEHHPHSLKDPAPLVAFVLKYCGME